jgi:uncharacterized protein
MPRRGVPDPEAAIRTIARWVGGRPDVRAAALVGSHARGGAGPGSDLDVVLLTDDPALYVERDDWVAELGLGRLVRTRSWGAVTERRILGPSGLEVEIGVTTPAWAATDPVDPGTRAVVAGGMRALHDPAGILAALARAVAAP